jgi:hypothetical protein
METDINDGFMPSNMEETVLIEHDLKMSFIKYIADENHYKEVLSLVGKAKQTVHFLPFGLRRIPVWRGSSNVLTR